ncbi:hypothetical protein Sru01_41870 [Sphaerisporangium rufum]|uniref:P/Homo B domain-containing protein n=1 Tax=Sphaerisporangium rufum TaxID=1381558 RepID=A0A919R8E2_9ACTN|nr:hypothetical protein [Sphaerisporangium rufum]GII79205.1 hypothetical protein Sru01_41870 [Sphaerisporangium rufum]
MMQRIATALVAVAVGASALAAAGPAFAEPAPESAVIDSVRVSPDRVVLRGRDRAEVTATVQTTGAEKVEIGFEPTGNGGRPDCNPCTGRAKASAGGSPQVWSRSIVLDRGDPDGRWLVKVKATGEDGKVVSATASFLVRHENRYHGPRATRIERFNAAPEPVRKGRKLSLTGSLRAARCHDDQYWDGDTFVVGGSRCRDGGGWHRWHQVGRQDLEVYFRPSGSAHWRHQGSIDTDADGDFSAWIRAYRSGTWKVVFDGSRGLTGSSAADYVKVVR